MAETASPARTDGPEDRPRSASSTEDVAAAPGWLEPAVDKAFATLGLSADAVKPLRDSYIDCLAGVTRKVDLDVAHDSCRLGLLRAMKAGFELPPATLGAFEKELEAVESDLTESL